MPKQILKHSLLAFVYVTIGYLIATETRSAPPEAAETDNTAAAAPTGDGHRVIAYYFHRTKRCKTCRTIEAYAHDALAEAFPEALASGKLTWRVVNLDEPAGTAFVDEFGISTSTVVLVEFEDDQRTHWQNLDRVWELVGDELEFKTYIEGEAMMYLELEL